PAVALSARVGPGIVAMLGVFGIIYISIALAHTFYPSDVGFVRECRRVCRVSGRRVVLLAAAILLALGAAPGALLVVPIALGLMLYLLPTKQRWWMPFAVLGTTTAIALAVLLALNGFQFAALAQQLSLSVAVLSWQ